MEQVALPGRLPVVVVRPPAGLSTAEVYRHCQPGRDTATAGQVVSALQRGNRKEGEQRLLNRLQAPAEQLSPWVGKLTAALKRHTGAGHMSGSGSSCFVIGKSARHARRLAAQLRAEGWQASCHAATTNRVERT
jgi:4-diphosphocytidyl-2-C-methyl-D-erythritol kinase